MPSTIVPARNLPGAREFATTRWSAVLAAQSDSSRAAPALAALCEAYWYPLYAFVRRQGRSAHDAQDLTQSFFAQLLDRGSLADVARERGRFRSWLLAAMKHFLSNEWRRTQRQKRGAGAPLVSLDDAAEARYIAEPAHVESADALYDRCWALTLLDRVLTRLEAEHATPGKTALFEALKDAITGGCAPYAEVAAQLGSTEGAVKVAAHRLRQRYRALLREEVAEIVAAPEEIDAELRQLFSAL